MISLLTAAAVALFVSLLGTRFLIPWLQLRGVGQPIRLDGPQGHMVKAGTPTMGGVAIVAAVVVGYGVSHLRDGTVLTRSGITLLATVVAACLVGLLDDYLKVSRERDVGLNKRAKAIGLLLVAVGFAMAAGLWVGTASIISFTRIGFVDLSLPRGPWIVWAVLVLLAASNSVNLTDGLDGLAGGAGAVAFAAFVVIGYWAFRHPGVYGVGEPLDLAVIAAALAGACTGFLWWNAPPARIFMGDAGSLAIGAAMAGLAVLLHVDLLLPVIGGLYVIETMSVIAQVGSYRVFGRRILRMAPIHHHFELVGWPETTVLIRLWVVNGLLVALALGVYYADYLSLDLIELPAGSL
ncbi:MAG TPA: phospho-N-acetylmuramoyl-pentapeptide-transferase [Acidimicrobiaceae bacterium]|nr:phospho-N-acetylmuramoyl-pentapeptide-transferase [Acidimicrobiaceae bacterium]HCB37715.1 phospho-N-acetylmuramoyl-pentapeptide-transferase [Acidimicrobiaceae bacterium]